MRCDIRVDGNTLGSYQFGMRRSGNDHAYPLRLSPEDAKAVNDVCQQSSASFDRVVSLCVRMALPEVSAALAGKTGRVTNVDPLPVPQAKRLYEQPEDDADSIRLFIAAQSTVIEE